jgi:hypothetical protein
MLKVKRSNGDILNTINHFYNVPNPITADLYNTFGFKNKNWMSPELTYDEQVETNSEQSESDLRNKAFYKNILFNEKHQAKAYEIQRKKRLIEKIGES